MVLSGRPHERLLKLHEKYGETVRVAPNELSFINPEAWNEVMGHRNSNNSQLENNKDPHYVDPSSGTMISAPKPDHTRMRSILNTAFSSQAMRDQAPRIAAHVDRFLERLEELGRHQESVNLVKWYHFTLFDIVSDLTLGEPFGCLESGEYHPWVAFIFARANLGAYVRTLLRLPGTEILLRLLVPRKVMREAEEHLAQTRAMVTRRFQRLISTPDFVGSMMKGKGFLVRKEILRFPEDINVLRLTDLSLCTSNHQTMTKEEIYTNTEVLIMGGSETTASGLCATTFLLASNKDVMSRCVEEITTTFAAESEIDIFSVSKLTYLEAIIKESLRLYPPAPNALPRKTPPQGNIINGKFIPGNTVLGLWQWTINRASINFRDAHEFRPERWLGDTNFADDRKAAFQPFSYGPRNCIGQR
ncbi:hypothetical protein MCOR25_009942 [Pyricularia grisea]|nr:hypothetical protein MCOR25_009942 [Pyricularia grisea]